MKETATNKEKFIWNMLGSLSNAFSSLILSISVNRILGGNSGGIFAFAYSNAQLMLTIGGFEVRPYQSTDVKEKYSFNAYFSFRIISCLLMLIVSVGYVLIGGFGFEKGIVIVFLTMFKMVEAFADVFGGRFQQKDRIDITGKLFFIRVVSSTIIFIIIMLATHNLVAASIGMFIVSFLLFFINDYRYIFEADKKNIAVRFNKIPSLIKEVLPLFIGNFIMMYISNAPKYAINSTYGDNVQNIYNILFMPAFVINLFSLFVFRPMLVTMATNWSEGNKRALSNSIIKMYGIIAAATVIAMAGAWLLGIPVLGFLYNVELAEYRNDLVLVMVSGGISALVTFSYYVITILRQQTWILAGYIAAFIYAIFTARIMVKQYAIRGAIFAYGSSVGIIAVIFIIVIIFTIKKRKAKL